MTHKFELCPQMFINCEFKKFDLGRFKQQKNKLFLLFSKHLNFTNRAATFINIKSPMNYIFLHANSHY